MRILKLSKPFPNTIKWKDCQMDPIGFCFAESLRGIKRFQDFKKADYFYCNANIVKRFYLPKGLCEAEPNGVHLTVFTFYCV